MTERRSFARHPFQLELIELDLQGWLDKLRASLRDDSYVEAAMQLCDYPKTGGAIRPGGLLSIEDSVVFAACVDAAYANIYANVAHDTAIDQSYRLLPPEHKGAWFAPAFEGWQRFCTLSIAKLDAGAQAVAVVDVAACYEHIDLRILSSDMKSAGVEPAILAQLNRMLGRWCVVNGRGLPQGHSASDVLAKLYLTAIDLRLGDLGYSHLRYVDDFRIFCDDDAKAKTAIVKLIQLLRERGLSIQSAKLKILIAAEARTEFQGVQPIIADTSKLYLEKLFEVLGFRNPYMWLSEAEDAIANLDAAEFPLEVIYEAFDTYFIEESHDFQKSLFRFILKRLGKAGDPHVVPLSVDLLRRHPEETQAILDYLACCSAFPEVDEGLTKFLSSPESVYPYQRYEIIESLAKVAYAPSPSLRECIVTTAFDPGSPAYVRAVARKYLITCGQPHHWDRLLAGYATEGSVLGQCEIICSIARMEITKRNSFLAKVSNRSDYHSRAERWVKQRYPS